MKIITEHPDAIQSPDYIAPVGAIQDNHSSEHYIGELFRMVNNKPFSYMDLGCAGGQAVIDIYRLGYLACGIEGSDLNKMLTQSKHGVANNWRQYKDICLFKADITKPFEVLSDDNGIIRFDIITAWDFLEHPAPYDIPNVLENVKKHMHRESIFISLISMTPFSHHQTVRSKEWWLNEFEKAGLLDIGFDMEATPRNSTPPIVGNEEIGFKLKLQ